MRVIINDSIDPYFNMAAEEYLLKKGIGEIIMLWQNQDAVIIGINQNAYLEVDLEYARNNGIAVLRRLSGGGAVYHDMGNINYSVFTDNVKLCDFEYFCQPIIKALKSLGVDAKFSGRNDITVEGKKISGNAQCKIDGRMMHHGTLLFSGFIERMEKVLKKREIKFIGKNVNSIKKRVGNIKEYLKSEMTPKEFMNYIANNFGEISYLEDKEREEISKLAKEKYALNEWNIGKNSSFDIENEKKYSFGIVKARISLINGIISDIEISGDFFSDTPKNKLYLTLIGKSYKINEIKALIDDVDISSYINGMTKEQFIQLIFGEQNE